eukprot:gene8878-biopygen2045
MREIYNTMRVKKSQTTAYHPQGEGLVERQNRTLQKILSNFVSDHSGGWYQWADLFEENRLLPAEDPILYLWRLEDALHHAEPYLSEDAFVALLRQQFFKRLPNVVQLKLLESHSTPGLDEMLAFSKRFRSLQIFPSGNAACATTTTTVPPQFPCDEPEYNSRDDLHMLLTHVVESQNQLIAAIADSYCLVGPHGSTPLTPLSLPVQPSPPGLSAPVNSSCKKDLPVFVQSSDYGPVFVTLSNVISIPALLNGGPLSLLTTWGNPCVAKIRSSLAIVAEADVECTMSTSGNLE